MGRFFLLLFVCLLIFSCKKKSASDCSDNKYSYSFYENKKIDTPAVTGGFFYQITGGDKIVFEYIHNQPECKNISDDEVTNYLVFQLASSAGPFTYQNSQLTDITALYRQTCYCANINARHITSGTIKGIRLTPTTWEIDVNVDVPAPLNKIVFKKVFTLR